MQLRTVKKPKIKDFDFGNASQNDNSSNIKQTNSKESNDKEALNSSNEV